MVRPVIARILSFDDCSLRKCIRPLASGLLLQPGPDEIRTSCFPIASSGTKPAFGKDLQNADQLFRHHPRTSQLSGHDGQKGEELGCDLAHVRCARLGQHDPDDTRQLGGQSNGHLIHVHSEP